MRKILFLALLAGTIWTSKAQAQALWPAATGDSLTLEVNCLDSSGRRITCDSIYAAAWRYTTGATPVLVDSGRVTTFPATTGTFRIYLRNGSDQTYLIRLVGNATTGLYELAAVAYGGTDDGVRLNWPIHRYYQVGSATTTNFYAQSNVLQWNTGNVPAPTVTGVPKVDPNTWDGTDITTGVPLAPTTAGRTLDVSAAGDADAALANIGTHGGTSFVLTGDHLNFASSTANTISITPSGGWDGINITNLGTGKGIAVQGGGAGVDITGVGANPGLKITGGSTGHALQLVGGSTSGDGFNISTTSGDGIDAASAGAGNFGYKGTIQDTTGIDRVNLAATTTTVTNEVRVNSIDSLYWVGRADTIRVNGIALNSPVSGRVDVSVGNMGAGVLESADAAAGFYKSITDTIWNERSDGHTAANTFGLFVDTTVSSRSSAAGSTDTAAIKTMMTNNRFARHFRSPGNPADTVNAVASLQSLGSGPYTATVYFLDSATSAAVQGWNASYRDSATQTQFTQAMASDANGKVQANVIGSTTYFVRGAKTAYRFAANADTTLNVAAVNFTDTVLVVGTGPTAPSSASVVRIDGNVRGLDTRGIPGLKVTATLIKKSGLLVVQYPNTDSSNTLVDYTFQSPARTDTSGAFTIDVPRLQTLSDTSLSYTLSFKGKNRDGKEVIYTWPCTRPPNVANWKWKPTNCVNE